MKNNAYFHNPRCRKSREGLELLKKMDLDFEIIEYLQSPPSEDEVTNILNQLEMKPLSLMRTQERIFKELNLSKKDEKTDEEWIRIMVENPILIERPIFMYNGKVALGRPPDNLKKIVL